MRKQFHRQRLIDMFINRIYLYDDKLVITFNHKEGAETITLDDVETALAEKENGSDLVSSGVPKIRKHHQVFPDFCYMRRKGLVMAAAARLQRNPSSGRVKSTNGG